ncbi:MAG: hypothetical protein M1820_000494 [Bogoriella megaspora]|nr:MAG: hypothetical protein M1820_000494 [Bogoriella megaspora]
MFRVGITTARFNAPRKLPNFSRAIRTKPSRTSLIHPTSTEVQVQSKRVINTRPKSSLDQNQRRRARTRVMLREKHHYYKYDIPFTWTHRDLLWAWALVIMMFLCVPRDDQRDADQKESIGKPKDHVANQTPNDGESSESANEENIDASVTEHGTGKPEGSVTSQDASDLAITRAPMADKMEAKVEGKKPQKLL